MKLNYQIIIQILVWNQIVKRAVNKTYREELQPGTMTQKAKATGDDDRNKCIYGIMILMLLDI
jgi:hypothetical protein